MNHTLCTPHHFAFRLSQFCYTWVAFPFSILIVFVYCMFMQYVYMYTFIVVFGILMEFVLYATVIAGTKTHKHNVSHCAGI